MTKFLPSLLFTDTVIYFLCMYHQSFLHRYRYKRSSVGVVIVSRQKQKSITIQAQIQKVLRLLVHREYTTDQLILPLLIINNTNFLVIRKYKNLLLICRQKHKIYPSNVSDDNVNIKTSNLQIKIHQIYTSILSLEHSRISFDQVKTKMDFLTRHVYNAA